jgi:hypothetical protein
MIIILIVVTIADSGDCETIMATEVMMTAVIMTVTGIVHKGTDL